MRGLLLLLPLLSCSPPETHRGVAFNGTDLGMPLLVTDDGCSLRIQSVAAQYMTLPHDITSRFWNCP